MCQLMCFSGKQIFICSVLVNGIYMAYLKDSNYIIFSSLNLNLFSLKSEDCTVDILGLCCEFSSFPADLNLLEALNIPMTNQYHYIFLKDDKTLLDNVHTKGDMAKP